MGIPARGSTVHGSGVPRTRTDGLAECSARLRRALRRCARIADPGNPLAVAQLEVLFALADRPGTEPAELARALRMRQETATAIVGALASQGMIDRVTPDADRQAVELTVTDAGRKAVLTWQATNAAVLHLALSSLPVRHRRALDAAVPALDALAEAVGRLADMPPEPAAGEG
jgi:DNA-binding MarR family transcriptional regulator